MQKIHPCLWFDNNGEEAVNFYTSIFKNSKILQTAHYGEDGVKMGRVKGSVMTIAFELDGQRFMALNGGPIFKFSPAISLVINCENQEEIDHFWEKLPAGGGNLQQCGWLQDKFGISWQVVPKALGEMMDDKDSQKTERVMHAVMQMIKLDIKTLEAAYKG